MKRKLLAALMGFCSLCVAVFDKSLAQQGAPAINTSPLVEQLLRAAPDGEQLVELSGYVGSSTPETVRLYRSPSLSSYFEIPRAAIVHSVQDGDPKKGLTTLYVRSSATIVTALRHSANRLAPTSQRAETAAGARSARPRLQDSGCWEYAVQCAAGIITSCWLFDVC